MDACVIGGFSYTLPAGLRILCAADDWLKDLLSLVTVCPFNSCALLTAGSGHLNFSAFFM